MDDLKQIVKDEGLDILDNVLTLADGTLSWDDAKAVIDLVVGTSLNGPSKGKALEKINEIVGNSKKSSAIPIPDKVIAKNGLSYKSNPKHTSGGSSNNPKAGIEPPNSLELFNNSIPASGDSKKRFAVDRNGQVHQFTDSNDGTFHWAGSTSDARNPLPLSTVPPNVKRALNLPMKGKLK